jgi:hypothetical protein
MDKVINEMFDTKIASNLKAIYRREQKRKQLYDEFQKNDQMLVKEIIEKKVRIDELNSERQQYIGDYTNGNDDK